MMDRPPLVATVDGNVVLLRRLERCEKVWGPSGTIALSKGGTGSYTLPGSGFNSCSGWVDALDRDGAPLWATPVELRYPNVTIVGDKLLAAGTGGLATVNVANGFRASMSDPVIGREACVDSSGARAFFNDWDDRSNDASVDLTTMKISPARREQCAAKPFTQCDARTAIACLEPRDERRPPTLQVATFEEQGTLRTKTEEVLIGRRTQGRKLPMIVAIDPRTHAKRWSLVVPPPDDAPRAGEAALFPHRFVDIADGKLFIEYDAWASHPHLAAFDMKDGARVWDVSIDGFVAFTEAGDRVYLMEREGVKVLDAKTGCISGLVCVHSPS